MIHESRFISQEYLDVLQRLFPNPGVLDLVLHYFVPLPLNVLHAHPRDARIKFYDEIQLAGEAQPRLHQYIIDGDANSYVSCTTFIHQFFGHFDADEVIGNMMRGRNWQHSAYFGMTPDQIKAQWEENRDQAARLGTAMHLNLERFYNGLFAKPEFLLTPEWQYFQNYLAKNPGLEPYRTEWEIFDEKHKVSGSVDMLYKDPARPGCLIVADWKRSKEIKWSDRKKGKGPVEHLDDCNAMHYSLQVNLYRWVLERNYGVTVSRMFLLRLHPNDEDFEQLEIDDMQDEIQQMMAMRLAKLAPQQ